MANDGAGGGTGRGTGGRRPIVGISACIRQLNVFPYHAVNQRYLFALSDASRVMPFMIPALADRIDPGHVLDQIDGLVLTGSPSNVEPHHYGQERAAEDILHDSMRDATTLPLIRLALERGIPLFAVCRGIQELNVALGGTLHQFVHEVEGRNDHRSDKSLPPEERSRLSHTVRLEPDGVIAGLIGESEVMVNSLHGQACDRLGRGLVVEATSDDGTIEAVRVENATTFALGVQWHPEALYAEDELSRRLFEAFGDAVREYAESRGKVRAA